MTLKLENDTHQNGNVYYDADMDVSVFEDTQESAPRFYGWRGTFEDHDTAQHTATFGTRDDAWAAALTPSTL